jgi:PPOX class probable F420-dependent enzyme
VSRAAFTEEEEVFVRWARVARLATVAPDGAPHVVPICPVFDEDDERIVVATESAAAKVRNVLADPRVAIVFDDYLEDWSLLRSVMVRGRARIMGAGPDWHRFRSLTYSKYQQYEPVVPIVEGESVFLEIEVEDIVSSGFE